MSQETFVLKQFSINQDKCPMKIGTDAVLLGSWVTPTNEKRILDVGTGTGILALMLAQKSTAHIDAIDIDITAVEQAKENVEFCKWRDRLVVTHATIQQYSKQVNYKYDLIVTNPPYFTDSSKPPEEGRTLARHNDYLPFNELIESVIKLLEPKGKFFLILPTKEAGIFKELAEKKGLKLSKLLRVRTRQDKETEKRHMMQFEFFPSSFSESTIIIEKDARHEYTDEYKELTKEYYINF